MRLTDQERELALHAWRMADGWAGSTQPETSKATEWGHIVLEAYDALLTELEQAEKQANCDCVPCIISSKSCRKCGRRAIITQEQFVSSVSELEARLSKAEDELSDLAVFTAEETGRLRDANLLLAKMPALMEAASNAKSWIENYPLNMNHEGDWAALRDELGEALADLEQE